MLEWNVYIENFNKKEITTYNIFTHYSFYKDLIKIKEKYGKKKSKFVEEVKKSLMYYFWSKCEWEIILSDWPPSEKFKDKKISVFDQVNLNLDKFIEYTWKNKDKIVDI